MRLESAGAYKDQGDGKPFHEDQGSGGGDLLPHVVVEGDGVHKDHGHGGHQHVCPLLGHIHVLSGVA